MIRVIAHKDIDKKRWDETLEKSGFATVCASSWYLDKVSPGWKGLVKNDYEAIMPLTIKRRLGIDFLMQPAFTQQLGCFFRNKVSAAEYEEFVRHIPESCAYIDLNMNESFTGVIVERYEVQENVNYLLKIDRSYEEHFKDFSYNTRRNIKKAPEDLTLVNDFDWKEAVDIFRKNKGTELGNFNASRQKLLLEIFDLLKRNNVLETYGVKNAQGELIAAAFFACGFGKKVFIFSATGEEGKETRAMFFLIDRFIKQHESSNVILDFEGSNDPLLARFYENFGAGKRIYKRIRRNSLPFWLRWTKR